MTESASHSSNSHRAIRAGAAVAVASVWLATWSVVEGAVYVWMMLLGVYVMFLSFAPFVGVPSSDHSKSYQVWIARFIRVGGWFVLSGFLAIGQFVLYAIWREMTGRSLFPR